MAAPKAPMLDLSGKKAKDVTLAEVVFAAPIKSHLVHEAVRAEAAAARSGTQAAKSPVPDPEAPPRIRRPAPRMATRPISTPSTRAIRPRCVRRAPSPSSTCWTAR